VVTGAFGRLANLMQMIGLLAGSQFCGANRRTTQAAIGRVAADKYCSCEIYMRILQIEEIV
jgi:hypothetical protein